MLGIGAKVRFLPGNLMYFSLPPEVVECGVKYTFTPKSTVSGSDGVGPSAVHRSPAAAANGQKSIVATGRHWRPTSLSRHSR